MFDSARHRRRIRLAGSVSVVAVGLLLAQLVKVTSFASRDYQALGKTESQVSTVLPGLRGAIYARNGQLMATSVLRDEVIADPMLISDKPAAAGVLAKLLGTPEPAVLSKLSVAGGYSVVAAQVKVSLGKRVEALAVQGELPGINVEPVEARKYPMGQTAEPIVGRVGGQGQGAFGIEYQYQGVLRGQDGKEVRNVAANGLPLPGAPVSYVPPKSGSSLTLTIDPALQYYAEQALAGEIQATRALGGTAVVMDVATGQILAMASLMAPPPPGAKYASLQNQPVYAPRSLPTESWINQAVGYSYEPGSVAKIATFTAALQDGLITPNSTEVVPDHLTIDGSRFHDAEVHPTQTMTMQQILAQSSNVGTIMIARRLGEQRLAQSFKRFGWTEPTGLLFPGETYGYMKPTSLWSPTAIGSMPIGQDQLVTPLQILDSYNAIANGGIMAAPKLVLGITSPSGRFQPVSSPANRRIVPAKVDAEMIKLLSGVTGQNATAPAASIPGYVVAGKTGTSQKAYHGSSGYQPGAFWGTFVGMVPAAHPVLSAIVMLDQPTPIYGGLVAAPVFSQIMRYALQRYGVTPAGRVLGRLLPMTSQKSRTGGRSNKAAKS